MSSFLRAAPLALQNALAGPAGEMQWSANLYTITLVDGVTVLRWCDFDSALTSAGQSFAAQGQFLSAPAWKLSNSMEVPQLTLKVSALNSGFNGGAALQVQIHNGLLDGAVFAHDWAMMGADMNPDTLGVLPMFLGKVGAIDLDGITAAITVKGKVNDLDQYAPHNLYQVGCNHRFCDTGCTLSAATYTASYTVGTGPSTILIPWSGTAPANAAAYQNGTLVMTSGAASGSRRTIAEASSAGLALNYPLSALPAAGDGFTAFQGCDKTLNSGSAQSCTSYANTQHFRGFPFVPPPAAAY